MTVSEREIPEVREVLEVVRRVFGEACELIAVIPRPGRQLDLSEHAPDDIVPAA